MSKTNDFPCIFTAKRNITYVCSISLVNRYSKNRYCKKCQHFHEADFQNQISRRFFYGFSKILMLWKEEDHVFQLNLMFIYEIFPQTPSKSFYFFFSWILPWRTYFQKITELREQE